MKINDAESYKLPNGGEILLGQDINGKWAVSCWDSDLNNRWELIFDTLSEAKLEFERWRK